VGDADLAAASRALRSATEVMAVLQRQLSDVVELTETSVFAIHDRVDEIARTATGVERATVTSLYGELQFQDLTRQALDSVSAALARAEQELDAVAEFLEGGLGADALASAGEAMRALVDSYVMKRQRDVHAGITGG
jgi:hypothetical protein